jgi:penicillin-binding protein 2
VKRLIFKSSADLLQRDYSNIDSISQQRVKPFALLLLVPFLFLIGRLWKLQIAGGDEYLKAAQLNRIRVERVNAPRGLILDSEGDALATNLPEYAVYAVPSISKSPSTIQRLSKILGVSAASIVQLLEAEKRNSYSPVRLAINISPKTLTCIEEERPYLAGVTTAPEPIRNYPKGQLFAGGLGSLGRIDPGEYRKKRSLGYFPDDFVGVTGLELQYENLLHGQPGGSLVEVKAKGKSQPVGKIDPIPGKTLRLTINGSVQRAAEISFAEHNWAGAAVAIDTSTGAVIAMATAPTYNPNLFVKGIDSRSWKSLIDNKRKPLLNRAVDCLYPPGSTFKQVVAAAALETGAVTTSTSCFCTGTTEYGKKKFSCWAVHGSTDFYKAIADSCDIWFYKAGLATGPENIAKIASGYPLESQTGIDLPREMIGTIPSPEWKIQHFSVKNPAESQWFPGDTLNMSIGQGYVLVTPLQMALTTAATANGGNVYKPYILDQVIDPITGKTIKQTVPTLMKQLPVKPENLEAVRRGMRLCVTDGTGKIVNFKGVDVAAKTGSAQTTITHPTHGWFVAFAPYSHPKIAIAVVVEYGGHGADSAGVVASEMFKAYFKLKNNDEGIVAKSD